MVRRPFPFRAPAKGGLRSPLPAGRGALYSVLGAGLRAETENGSVNMYPEEMVEPMREELTSAGFREMRTPQEVDAVLASARGTALVVVNSICGCAAGKARPAVRLALTH